MILTLSPDPGIDRTITLAGELARGQVQRVLSVTVQSGGEGVTISRASVIADEPTPAVVPAAKDDPFVTELLAAGIDCRPVRPAGGVRVNITITEPDGTTTKLNSPDASVGAVHLEAMASTLLARAPVAAWTVLAGSLPAGAPPEFSAQLVRRLRDAPRHGGSGHQDAPLRALVESDPVKAAEAARILIDRGVGTVLATLGSNGAVLVTAEGSWHAAPPPTTVVSTVGLQSVRLSTRRHPRAVGARSPGARRGLRQRPPGSPGPPSPRRRTSTPTTHVGALMPTKSVVVGSAVGRRRDRGAR